ncbi:MAG TPA: hypothetical protein VGK92_00165 [Gaiellales bacterium]|jgi:hypothetical protein
MARRFLLAAVVAAVAVASPASALAATAAGAPTLTSAPYVKPATISWTPAVSDPATPLDPDLSQDVFRTPAACPAGVVATGASVQHYDMSTASHTTSDTIPDGTYCFHIRTNGLLTTADGPGLTVIIDTTSPTGTVAVAPAAAGNVLTGTVNVTGTSSDGAAAGTAAAGSGIGSTTFHVGAVNACTTGAVIPASWDTTTLPNGTYQVCNVIVDRAGHVTTVSTTVTLANAAPVAPVAAPGEPTATAPPIVTPPVIVNPATDPTAPDAPTKVTVTLPKAKAGSGTVAVKLHWAKPTASDLAKVLVVLNLKHAPRTPADGTKIYSGLGTSSSVKLKVGSTGYVALFAYDTSGNVSSPAQKLVSLAPLIPLRPTSGTTINTLPRLTWKAQSATAYYNVQLFRNGVRVLTGWPTKAAFSIPAGKLKHGDTYVWFVWPAVKHGSRSPTFGQLIGRATFTYVGL